MFYLSQYKMSKKSGKNVEKKIEKEVTQKVYNFPTIGFSVKASSKEEAIEKANEHKEGINK